MRSLKRFLAFAMIMISVNAALAQDRPRVIVVNQALQYFAERLLDGTADVAFPVPENVDPSFWRPSITDISKIQSADLILLNGAGFATWIDRVSLPRSRVVNTTAAIEDQFIVTESITHSHGSGDEHSHEGLASYTWLDPTLAIAQAEAIAAAVVARDLASAEDVEPRLAELRSELMAMDQMAQIALGELDGIEMIATHPRYQYLARRYSLPVTSLEWEAGAMPTAEELADLENLIAETGAKLMIWEATPPEAALAATQSLGLQNVVFAPLARNSGQSAFVTSMDASIKSLADAVETVQGD